MTHEARNPSEDPIKEWETVWKKFSEVLGFLYDNEGVIKSLKKKETRTDVPDMREKLEKQETEIHHLIDHHVEDLVQLTEKAKIISKQMGKDLSTDCEGLITSIKSLNVQEIEKKIKDIKENLKQ